MITYSSLNSSVPTTAPRCFLPFYLIYISIFISECTFSFFDFTISHDLLAFGKFPFLDQKYLVYSFKLVYSLVFLHSLYNLHTQNILCYLLLLYLIVEEIQEHKGSPCVVPSADVISSPPDMKNLASRLYEFMTYVAIIGHIIGIL